MEQALRQESWNFWCGGLAKGGTAQGCSVVREDAFLFVTRVIPLERDKRLERTVGNGRENISARSMIFGGTTSFGTEAIPASPSGGEKKGRWAGKKERETKRGREKREKERFN